MITAPYNFVPLNDKIFYPDWADKVSHDIPFGDGESGEIEIEITAHKPIFIRNHYVESPEHREGVHYYKQNNKKVSTEFCHYRNAADEKVFYIPGSSLKGMVKNILKVMSFSRIQIEDKRYSFRDINNKDFKKGLMDFQDDIECGWLYEENGVWKIHELGLAKPFKYTHDEIATLLADDAKAVQDFPKDSFKPKTPDNKYKAYNFDIEKLRTTDNRIAVFTGTVQKYNDKEWLFPAPVRTSQDTVLDAAVVKAFQNAYYIGQPEESKVWKTMWKSVLAAGGFVPVFFLKRNGTIQHFGLSLLYKLPYQYTTSQLTGAHNQETERHDVSELMFGYSRRIDDRLRSLKSRVQFEHFEAVKADEVEEVRTAVLSTPKPTYFPNYLTQNGKNGKIVGNNKKYKTYSDEDALIRGWKQYPLQEGLRDNQGTDGVSTKFKPLKDGAVFGGKIRFHNLKEVEIGALLSALTFHGQSDKHHHNIGMAKPLGYGEIQLNITGITSRSNHKDKESLSVENMGNYLAKFEAMLDDTTQWDEGTKPFDGAWRDSRQIRELLAIYQTDNLRELEYQKLDNPNSIYTKKTKKGIQKQKNEFVGAKNNKEYLKLYSELFTSAPKPKSTHATSPTPTPQPVNASAISNKQMNNLLSSKKVFGIFFQKNQLVRYKENQTDRLPPFVVEAYRKFEQQPQWKEITDALYRFYKGELSEAERVALYDRIKDIFS